MPAEQSNLCDEIQPWLAAYALGDAEEGRGSARASRGMPALPARIYMSTG